MKKTLFLLLLLFPSITHACISWPYYIDVLWNVIINTIIYSIIFSIIYWIIKLLKVSMINKKRIMYIYLLFFIYMIIYNIYHLYNDPKIPSNDTLCAYNYESNN